MFSLPRINFFKMPMWLAFSLASELCLSRTLSERPGHYTKKSSHPGSNLCASYIHSVPPVLRHHPFALLPRWSCPSKRIFYDQSLDCHHHLFISYLCWLTQLSLLGESQHSALPESRSNPTRPMKVPVSTGAAQKG